VLGTSDMGARGITARRPLPVRQRVVTARVEEPAPRPEVVAPVAAETHALHGVKAMQDEFGFGEVESRGQFERTDRNLFDGQDLDVPTYLRKGIKIAV
jgi:cell division protein FtsZ